MLVKKEKSPEKFIMLEHEADIKFQAFGATLDEGFVNSALALTSYISGNQKIDSRKGKIIEVSGTDISSLLYNFLDEILYLLDAEHFILSKVSVFLRGNNLKAELFGDSTSNYKLDHVKAATYSEMKIRKVGNKWVLQFVMDV